MSEPIQIQDQSQNSNHIDLDPDNEDDVVSQGSRFSEDFHSDVENDEHIKQVANEEQKNDFIQPITEVKNPVSSYMMFVKGWKDSHPGEKLNISMMGDIWKQLTEKQKLIYDNKYKQEKIKYDEYVSEMMARDPNFRKKNSSQKYLFPLHRIKAIMKLDHQFNTTNQSISCMAKITEYFGEVFLEEVKKATEGRKRIDVSDFFSTIHRNQTNLWFLNCLQDQYNLQKDKKDDKREKPEKQIQMLNNIEEEKEEKNKEKKEKKTKGPASSGQKKNMGIAKGQMKLTDMF